MEKYRERMRIELDRERLHLRDELDRERTRMIDASEAQRSVVAMTSQIDMRMTQLSSTLHSSEVQRLKDALTTAQCENERLRGSNHVKGIQGEAVVMAVMRREFEDWVFTDTSSRGAQSDFHMTSVGGDLIAVEVKNKAAVTVGDVEKSTRDVHALLERFGGKLIGYVFVSLRTRNIPHKGGLSIESVQGVPVLWYGADAHEDASILLDASNAADLGRSARLLADVGRCMRRVSDDTTSSNALFDRLNTSLARTESMRRMLGALDDSLLAARRHAASLSSTVDTSFRELEAFLRAEGNLGTVGVCSHVTCETCNRQFANSKGLAIHRRTCTLPMGHQHPEPVEYQKNKLC
jgi:hypothetical protein